MLRSLVNLCITMENTPSLLGKSSLNLQSFNSYMALCNKLREGKKTQRAVSQLSFVAISHGCYDITTTLHRRCGVVAPKERRQGRHSACGAEGGMTPLRAFRDGKKGVAGSSGETPNNCWCVNYGLTMNPWKSEDFESYQVNYYRWFGWTMGWWYG